MPRIRVILDAPPPPSSSSSLTVQLPITISLYVQRFVLGLAADVRSIGDVITSRPTLVLGLATGTSPISGEYTVPPLCLSLI